MTLVASTTVDLARAQFATTSLYHFLFVPLTLGLGPIVAVIVAPLVLLYQGWTYHVFRQRLGAE